MKIKPKIKVEEPESRGRGRPKKLGGDRINFFPGEKLRLKMLKLEERRKRMKLPYAFTFSYLLREGGNMVVKHLKSLMDEAESGNLHAKQRVSEFGQQ